MRDMFFSMSERRRETGERRAMSLSDARRDDIRLGGRSPDDSTDASISDTDLVEACRILELESLPVATACGGIGHAQRAMERAAISAGKMDVD